MPTPADTTDGADMQSVVRPHHAGGVERQSADPSPPESRFLTGPHPSQPGRCHELDVPTQVFTGTEDAGFDAARVLAQLAAAATWFAVVGLWHMAPMESPAMFAAAVESFLDDLEGTS